MRLPIFFASRYLFSKKSVNAINIISAISVIGVLISSAALVIVLSFYNGMEKLILSLYSTFAPELRIEPLEGKVFATDERFDKLRKNSLVLSYTEVLEDKVLIQYDNQQFIAQVKGVEPQSLLTVKHENMLYAGDFQILDKGVPYAIIGAQVQANLRLPIEGIDNSFQIFSPRKGNSSTSINPMDEINIRSISPRAVLQYQQGYDNLIITPLNFAKDLLNEQHKISAIEIYTNDSSRVADLKKEIEKDLGSKFSVKDREQQNPLLYKTIRSEKWIVFFILTIIGIIAIFNIIGSLTMLVIDKKADMLVLQSLGANKSLIQRIFFYEGVIIAFMGSIIGIAVGFLFCLFQDKYGFITTGEESNSIMDVYPVDIRQLDFVLVFITIMCVATIVSYLAARLSVKEIKNENQL